MIKGFTGLSVLFFLLGLSAHAAENSAPLFRYGYKDWGIIEERVDPYLKVASCRAYAKKSNPESPVQFSLSFPKDYSKAPVAMISLGSALSGQKVLIQMASSQTELALPLENLTTSEGVTYWYVPVNMDQLIDNILNATALDIVVQMEDKEEPLKISLAGSYRTLQVLTKCLGKTDLYIKSFFKELNDPLIEALPISGDSSPMRLQEFFHMSYGFFISKRGIEQDLNALAEENKGILNSEILAQQNYEKNKTSLNSAQSTLGNLENEAETLNERLSTSRLNLDEINIQKNAAEAAVARMKEAFTPLQTKADQFRYEISIEQSTLKSLDDRIRKERSDITDATKKISIFESELLKISSEVTILSKELEQLQTERSGLNLELSSFNVDQETQKRVEATPAYQSARQGIQSLRDRLIPLESQMRKAQSEQILAQRKFEKCRRDNVEVYNSTTCAAEMATLQSAQSEFSQSQRDVRQINSEISRLETEIQSVNQSIRAQVMSERNLIQNKLKTAEFNILKVESGIRHHKAREHHINNSELPSNKSEVGSSQASLVVLQAEMSESQKKLSSLRLRFDEFYKANSYDRIQQSYVSATETLRNIETQRKSTELIILKSEKRLLEISSQKLVTQNLITQRQTHLNTAKIQLNQIQESLKEYRLAESQLQKGLYILDRQYKLSRGHYRFILQELVN